MVDDWVEPAMGAAVFFILLAVLVVPSFSDTQGDLTETFEAVDSEAEWLNVINDAQSSDYNVTSSGLVDLLGNSGTIETNEYTASADTLEVNVSTTQGDASVTVYNANGTSIGSATLSGDDSASITVSDFDQYDGYYLEVSSTSTTDTHVDSYETTGTTPVSDDVQVLIYLVLLLFLIGAAMAFYSKM